VVEHASHSFDLAMLRIVWCGQNRIGEAGDAALDQVLAGRSVACRPRSCLGGATDEAPSFRSSLEGGGDAGTRVRRSISSLDGEIGG
jgi:hypothetical protein